LLNRSRRTDHAATALASPGSARSWLRRKRHQQGPTCLASSVSRCASSAARRTPTCG